MEDRVQFTAAAFFYDYKDLQVGFVNQQSVVETINAASAHNYGVETELAAKLTPHLQATVAATYLSAKYTSFVNSYYREGFAPVNVSGNYLDNAPPYTARLGLAYDVPLPGAAGQLLFKGEGSYQGKVYFTGWVRNATDKFALANNIISAPLYANVRVGTLMPPRTYGVTFGYQF